MALLLDENVWNGFILKNEEKTAPYDNSILAVGAPTIDLWLDSWKQIGNSPFYIGDNVADEGITTSVAYLRGSGYLIGATNPPEDNSLILSNLVKADINNKVYFPHTDSVNDECTSYWLAAPSSIQSDGNLLRVSIRWIYSFKCIICI